MEKIDASTLLSLNKYNVDEGNAHIEIDNKICAKCDDKPCLYVCPAVLYKQDATSKQVTFDYAGCLECGTCRIMCKNKGIVKWTYPQGSYGVSFRYG